MVLIIVVAIFVLWFVVYRWKRRRLYELASLQRGPKEFPLIGFAHKLMGDTEDIMTQLKNLSYLCISYDGLLKGWLGHILYFFVMDENDLEFVLKTCLEKDDLHRFLRKVLGNGGIFAPVNIWRRRRKVMVPAFSPKIVENFVDVFAEQSETLVQRLVKHDGGEKFRIWQYLSTYTLDSVCETAMGVNIGAQTNPDSPFLVAMNRILNIVTERIFHLWLQPDWLFKCFKQYTDHQKSVQVMHSFTDDVIQKKRDEIANSKNYKTEAESEYNIEDYKRKTFLDLLIKFSGGDHGYNNVELREEMLVLAIAGTDTSAVAVGNTLKLLTKYPEIQEKLYQELYDVFGNSDRPLVKEDLPKLAYLDRVVKESLRLFPPVPFIIRKVLKETKLPSGNILPAGSGVVVSIWGMHRHPKYWGPDAEKFDPDRFLPERFKLARSCCYMPFSQGPRNCLGYQYASISVKTALTAIIRRYRMVGEPEKGPVPNIRTKLDVMMKAVDGYEVQLERRTTS